MSTIPSDAALTLESVHYAYRSDWFGRPFTALKGITLSVGPGEAFGFLGHNGAGKTTTIRCILGLIRNRTGEIKIFGRDHRDPEARRPIGYLPEHPYFYDHLTVTEMMTLYATLAGVARAERPAAIRRALDAVKISTRAATKMRALSKGLTQRVAMAQAIVARPKLLLLDEPFSGLDPLGRRELRSLLQELRREGTALFMSSHALSDVEQICDRAAILAHGELRGVFELRELPQLVGGSFELTVAATAAQAAPLVELAGRHEVRDDVLVCFFNSRESAERGLRAALAQNLQVLGYEFVRGSLEDLFVRLVQFDEAGGEH